mgnify:CR=1 FL=1
MYLKVFLIDIVMSSDYDKKRVPEYLDPDEFFRDAQGTVSIGIDVRDDIRRESDRPLTTDDTISRNSIEGLF